MNMVLHNCINLACPSSFCNICEHGHCSSADCHLRVAYKVNMFLASVHLTWSLHKYSMSPECDSR
jgi:hypothetical protein